MIQKRYESGDSALEINVIFPERVIRVDEQGLLTNRISFADHHINIITGDSVDWRDSRLGEGGIRSVRIQSL
jgi:hypothetical protein